MLYSHGYLRTMTRRKSTRANVDLIGFLDILSSVIVIVLLVISVLALSIGVKTSSIGSESEDDQARESPTANKENSRGTIKPIIRTDDGVVVTGDTAFFLCKNNIIHRFRSDNSQVIGSWDLGTAAASTVANSTLTSNAYIAISGSCFNHVDDLVEAFREKGISLGYDPIPEEAVVPWQ